MDRNTGGKIIHNTRYITSGLIPNDVDPNAFASGVWDAIGGETREFYRLAFDAVHEKLMSEWDGNIIKTEILQTDGGTAYRKTEPIMTDEELETIIEVLNEHSQYYNPKNERLVNVVKSAVYRLEQKEKNQVLKFKAFQDDILTYLRAIALVADTVGNADTHKEKNARMRGLLAQIESAIQVVRDGAEYLLTGYYTGMPDLFRSNYPVQQYINRCRELENEIKFLKGDSSSTDDGIF